MPSYTTLQSIRTQLAVRNRGRTEENPYLASFIQTASQNVEDYCGQNFDERLMTFSFNSNVGANNPTLLLNDRPLISVSSITNGDGSTIASDKYDLLPIWQYPKEKVRLKVGMYWVSPGEANGDCGVAGGYPMPGKAYAEDAIQITGFWGFNRRGTAAWRKLNGITVGTNYTSGATALALSGVPGKQLDIGSMLKIGDEQLLVTGDIANSIENAGYNSASLQVDGGQNGTVPADHASGADVYIWQVETVIETATRLTAVWLYETERDGAGRRQDAGGSAKPISEISPVARALLVWPYWSPRWGQRG